MRTWERGALFAMTALALTACAGGMSEDVDDTTGTHLQQSAPAGSPPVKPIPAGDITIVGQDVGHAIIDLPEIANAPVPPLVQFTGVTSIVTDPKTPGVPAPVDTEPYTELFRDRLLLITRLKLRFVEKTLPLLAVTPKKGKKSSSSTPAQNTTNPDYEILAELRGHYDADLYHVQVQFKNMQTGDILFDNVYSIRKEAQPGQAQVADPTASGDSTYEHLPPPPENTGTPAPAPAPAAPTAPAGVQ